MNTNTVYFERHVKSDSRKLIRASELRRKLVQSAVHGKNGYDTCYKYYQLLNDIMRTDTRLKSPILFEWNGYNSTCWKFEKLHILQMLSRWSHEIAVDKNPKEAKDWFSKAVFFETQMVKCLNGYQWVDPSISLLPIMNQRFHLSNAFLYASDYYFNMYNFKASLAPVKKSYQMLEIASRVWKKREYDQLNRRKALCLKHMAEELEDDKCGERVALMEEAMQLCEDDEIKEKYELWKQQNESVYYNQVSTDKTISCLSLQDSIQSLCSIST